MTTCTQAWMWHCAKGGPVMGAAMSPEQLTVIEHPLHADSVQGLVIHPYEISRHTPLVAFKDVMDEAEVESWVKDHAHQPLPSWWDEALGIMPMVDEAALRQAYHQAFVACHEALVNLELQKVVLARAQTFTLASPLKTVGQAWDLFQKARSRYPNASITLFSTPQTGSMLVCSPELLVSIEAGRGQTLALAGTMHVAPDEPVPAWSEKNQREQAMVTDYLMSTLTPWVQNLKATGPKTVRAGQLVHLATDVSFTLPASLPAMRIAMALHPTPALCGLTSEAAKALLAKAEGWSRRYYSGFVGVVDTHHAELYVNLRSAVLATDRLTVIAGGGLLPASVEASEWAETQAKMTTVLSLLD